MTDTLQNNDTPNRAAYLAVVLAAAAVFVVYLFTLAPTITGEDSGEFVTAAWTGGIAHPPGYPLYTMLGYVATHVLPFGDAAYRMNLMSAFFAAAAALVVGLITLRLGARAAGASVATLACGLGEQFWALAVTAEVHTLHALLAALLFLALILYFEKGGARFIFLGGLAAGLGLSNHHGIIMLAPGALVCFIWCDVAARRPLPRVLLAWLAGAAGVLLGLLPYLWLPLRSAADPWLDWGNPDSFEGLVNHVLRKQYAGKATVFTQRSAVLLVAQIGVVANYLAQQATPWLGALAFGGAVTLSRAGRRKELALLIVSIVFGSFGYILVTNFPPYAAFISANTQFFLSANVALAVLVGLGVAWLSRLIAARFSLGRLVGPGAVVVSAALLFASGFVANDHSDYYFADDHRVNIARTLDANAVLVSTMDLTNFALLYHQGVMGERADVDLPVRYGFGSENPDLGRRARDIAVQQGKRQSLGHVGQALFEADPTRPLYFAQMTGELRVPGHTLRPCGLLFRLYREDDSTWREDCERLWRDYEWRGIDLDAAPDDILRGVHGVDLAARYYVARALFMRGLFLLEAGELAPALEDFRRVSVVGEMFSDLNNNIGTALVLAGHPARAARFHAQALEAAPLDVMTRIRLAMGLIASGEPRLAEGVLRETLLIASGPERTTVVRALAEALVAQARLAFASGRYDDALGLIRQALDIAPDHGGARALFNELQRMPR